MFSISHLEEVFPIWLKKVQTSPFTVELPSFTSNRCKLFVSFCLQVYCAIRKVSEWLTMLLLQDSELRTLSLQPSIFPLRFDFLYAHNSEGRKQLCFKTLHLSARAEKGKLQTKLRVLSSKMSSKVFALFLDPGAIQHAGNETRTPRVLRRNSGLSKSIINSKQL